MAAAIHALHGVSVLQLKEGLDESAARKEVPVEFAVSVLGHFATLHLPFVCRLCLIYFVLRPCLHATVAAAATADGGGVRGVAVVLCVRLKTVPTSR